MEIFAITAATRRTGYFTPSGSGRIPVTTKQELKVVDFVFQRSDGQRQIVEMKPPKAAE